MTALYIILGVLGAAFVFFVLPTLLISNRIFSVLFVRTSKKKWSRSLSWDDEEQAKMFDGGEKWWRENEKYRKPLTVKSGKFSLAGEYFDFGFDKAVIIIPGRMETCAYSMFFAEPYKESGYNVLAIDNRSHGLSDGRFNTIGMHEYEDVIVWTKKLHDECGAKSVIYHGLCIGAATALYAMTDSRMPDYADGLIAEGMYINFRELFINQLKDRKKPLFPFVWEVMTMMRLTSGKSVDKNAPINFVKKMKKPMLFIYSRKDLYSRPDKAEILFENCASEKKKLVFFDKGVHSHVRINAVERYDRTIKDFIRDEIDG